MAEYIQQVLPEGENTEKYAVRKRLTEILWEMNNKIFVYPVCNKWYILCQLERMW